MLANWISEIKHKRLLRAAQREKELMQVMCTHEYEYMGSVTGEYYNGFGIDFYSKHQARCKKCHKIVKDTYYNNLKADCGLKEDDNET